MSNKSVFFLCALLFTMAIITLQAEDPDPDKQQNGHCVELLRRAEYEKTRVFIENNRERYERVLANAVKWLDAIRIDPLELRKHNIKGKKKLVEVINAYYRLHMITKEKWGREFRVYITKEGRRVVE